MHRLIFLLISRPAGKPGLIYTRAHQGEPSKRLTLLLRPGPAPDIRSDGEGLVPAFSPLWTLPGFGQPEESQRHVHRLIVVKRRWCSETISLRSLVLICHPVLHGRNEIAPTPKDTNDPGMAPSAQQDHVCFVPLLFVFIFPTRAGQNEEFLRQKDSRVLFSVLIFLHPVFHALLVRPERHLMFRISYGRTNMI